MQIREWGLALAACACLLTGLFPEGPSWLASFAYLPLFYLYLSPACSAKRLLLYTLVTGFIYYGTGIFGILKFSPRLYSLMVLLLTPTLSVYFLALRFLTQRMKSSSVKILAACLLWILLHVLYALTPLGTLPLDFSFYGSGILIQVIAMTGTPGLGTILIGSSFAAANFIRERDPKNGGRLVFFALLILSIYGYGIIRLREPVRPPDSPKLALIQHNLPISGMWRLDHPAQLKAEYEKLARQAAEFKPDLIVFPMFNLPEDPLRNPEFLGGLAKKIRIPILAAAHVPRTPGASILREGYMSVAVFYSKEGTLAAKYQAVKTAPLFGLVKEWTAPRYEIMNTPLGKIGILLCYEDTDPWIVREAVKNGAEILIALSNPGHFVETPLPAYHLFQDRLRAIETGRWLARVSANGYSATIDPYGRIVKRTHLNRQEVLTGFSETKT